MRSLRPESDHNVAHQLLLARGHGIRGSEEPALSRFPEVHSWRCARIAARWVRHDIRMYHGGFDETGISRGNFIAHRGNFP